MRIALPISLAALAIAASACQPAATPTTQPEAQPAAGPLSVYVSILPQKYFVERIGGDHVAVSVMVEPGASPATYEPKPEQMTGLAQTTAYVSIGVPFEKSWMEKIKAANTDMRVVDTTLGIERIPTANGGFDPHIWLSPSLVKIQAATIAAALSELDPGHQVDFAANLQAFTTEIDAIDAEIRGTLESASSREFIVFHPSWSYFARDYDLVQIPIEVEGQEPSAQELAGLIELAQAKGIRVVFVQPQFSQEDARTIAAEIGGEVVPINPLAPDWLANMRSVATVFAEVLAP